MEQELYALCGCSLKNAAVPPHATYADGGRSRCSSASIARLRSMACIGYRHAETITPQSMNGSARSGAASRSSTGMAYQGEYFVQRYGAQAAEDKPPVRRMLNGGAGRRGDGCYAFVASYAPDCPLLMSRSHAGGPEPYGPAAPTRAATALRLWTEGSACSRGTGRKGRIAPGQFADLACSMRTLFCSDEQINRSPRGRRRRRIVPAIRSSRSLAHHCLRRCPSGHGCASTAGYQGSPEARSPCGVLRPP